MKGITSKRVSESESHEMGLQIPRGVYPEATQEVDIRGAAQARRGDIPRVGAAQGGRGGRRTFDAGSRAYVHQHSTEDRGGQRGGIHQRQECDRDCPEVRRSGEEFHREVFWARGYFVSTVGVGRGHGSSVQPTSRERGRSTTTK